MNRSLRGGIDTHRAIAASAGLTLILGLVACGGGGGGGGNGPGSKRLNLVIGDSLPLSGSSKTLGESGGKASELAVEQITRAAGEAGADHTVRVVQEDQGADTGTAVASARKLVDGDRASCLTGPWSAQAVAQTAHDVAIPAKVLEISPVATDQDIAELNDHDLIDSTALPVSLEGDALSAAIEGSLGGAQGHTVNVAASNDTYGDTVNHDFVEAWQGDDGTVGAQIMLPPSGPFSDYSAQASEIAGGSPAAVLLIDDLTGFIPLARALATSSGWNPQTAWGGDQLVSPGLPAQIRSNAINGMRALAPGAPTDEPATSAFIADFRSASPRDVKLAPFAAQEFDATVLCYLAAVAAGSTDSQRMADELIDITAPGGDEYSWQQLPEAIKALEDGRDIDYTGASGPIDMDVHGNPTNGVYDVYRYTATGLEAVGEVPVSKPNPAIP
jgi:ABC-type branched-subunit amino acid transport system substrate-binding protein